MELNTDKITAESLQGILKLVEERDGIDKELAGLNTQRAEIDTKAGTLTDRRLALSKEIGEIAGFPTVTPAASTTASTTPNANHQNGHNGKGHPGKNRTKSKAKGKGAGKAAGKGTTKATGKRVAHGTVGETILQVLREAGPKGATIKDICKTFGLREDTVSKWLHTTMKKTGSGLKRPTRGQYVLHETASK